MFACLLFGIGLAWVLFTRVPASQAMENWAKTELYGSIRSIGFLLLGLGSVGLIAIGLIEWRILKGWEPDWLRKFIPGCVVIDIYGGADDPAGHRRLEIEHPSGWTEWYILDSAEVGLCDVGDTVHLWTIGKHVAHVVRLQSSEIVYPPQTRLALWGRRREDSQSGCAWAILYLAPPFGSFCVGKALEHIITGEVAYLDSEPYVGTGWDAWGPAYILLMIGLAVLIWAVVMWKKGWTDEFLEDLQDSALSRGRSRWWN